MTSKVLTYILGVLYVCVGSADASAQDHPDSLFVQARQLLSDNQRDSAVYIAEQVLAMDLADTLRGRVEHFIGYVMSNRYRYDDALPHLMRAIQILEPTGAFDGLVADAYLKAGQCSRDPEVKHALTSQAITKFEQLNDSVNMAAACLNLGLLCFRQGQIEKFRLMGAQGLNWLGDADRSDLRTRLHYAQGRYYNATGNFETALLFFEKSYEELIATNPQDPFIFNVCKDYGLLLADLGYYEEAVKVIQKPILPDSESKSPHRSYAEAGMLFDLGKVYMEAGQFALAEEAYNMSAKSIQPYYGDKHVFTAYPYSELTNLYLAAGETTKARASVHTALEILEAQKVYKHPDYARMSQRMHAGLLGLGEYEKALERLNAGLESLGYSDSTEMNLSEVYRYDILIDLMNRKTKLYAEHIPDADAAFRHYIFHIDLMDSIQQRQIDPSTRIAILEENYHVYEKAITHAYNGYAKTGNVDYARQILSLSERSKDQLYARFLLQNTIKSQYNVEVELLEEEKQLNKALAEIELELYKQGSPDSLAIVNAQQEAKDLRLRLIAVQNAINYPIDTRDIGGTMTAEIRPDPSVNLLHIFDGIESDFLIAHSRGKYNITRVRDSVHLESFVAALRDPTADWLSPGYEVYELLAPALSIAEPGRPLVIVPDGGWSQIPFEALPIKPAGESSFPPLLIESMEVSYTTSLRARQPERERGQTTKILAAYAPAYDMDFALENDTTGSQLYATLVRSGEYALPGASREAELISNTIGGDRYTGNDATEDHFRRNAADFQILHLSMHALLEDENPNYSRLIFTQTQDSPHDNYLFASELSQLSLNADLAVLSACNTGRGRDIKGEGVMSLSRAFNYAGVPSVVHSLWKVPDDATADIMPVFYVGLKEGESKSAALRRAKLEYMRNTLAPEQKHPYYWAGFVVNGDIQPISFRSNRWYHYGIVGIVAMAVLLIMGTRSSKRRRDSA